MRIFNDEGHGLFKEWVYNLKNSSDEPEPLHILNDPNLSYELTGSPKIELQVFRTKYDLVTYLSPIIDIVIDLKPDYESWPRIWDSFALFYFFSICERKLTMWIPLREERYIFDMTHTKSRGLTYRHHIYGPIMLYRTNSEALTSFYKTITPYQHTEIEENAGSRNEIGGNPVMLALINKLYISKDGTIKRGIKGREKHFSKKKAKQYKAGTINRLMDVCKQLRRTYDLYEISLDGLIKLLPVAEFASWLKDE